MEVRFLPKIFVRFLFAHIIQRKLQSMPPVSQENGSIPDQFWEKIPSYTSSWRSWSVPLPRAVHTSIINKWAAGHVRSINQGFISHTPTPRICCSLDYNKFDQYIYVNFSKINKPDQ
jgi:hypothetical protein